MTCDAVSRKFTLQIHFASVSRADCRVPEFGELEAGGEMYFGAGALPFTSSRRRS
jgi:hypothetical protein